MSYIFFRNDCHPVRCSVSISVPGETSVQKRKKKRKAQEEKKMNHMKELNVKELAQAGGGGAFGYYYWEDNL